MRVNGLTFTEWLHAAGNPKDVAWQVLEAAWQAGEDPCKWRRE